MLCPSLASPPAVLPPASVDPQADIHSCANLHSLAPETLAQWMTPWEATWSHPWGGQLLSCLPWLSTGSGPRTNVTMHVSAITLLQTVPSPLPGIQILVLMAFSVFYNPKCLRDSASLTPLYQLYARSPWGTRVCSHLSCGTLISLYLPQ